MNAFATAESELSKTGPDAILEAVSATDIAFARFIADVENTWDEEEDFDYSTPPDLRAWGKNRRNRLDDLRDGRLTPPETPDYVETALTRAAESLHGADPQSARRINRLAISWCEDRRLFEQHPGWARRNGIIPGADTAPSLASLLSRLGLQSEPVDPRRACAMRIAALAYRQLHTTSAAYAQACCAEFAYAGAIGEPPPAA